MATLDDFEKTLRGVVAAQRRPQPKLTRAEITSILDAARPIFAAYEQTIAELKAAGTIEGPTWYGYDNQGNEYTGDMKKHVLTDWMQANEIPEDTQLLRATLGEKKSDGPRARGPVTFYTYPSPTGIAALWVAKSSDLSLLQGMVSSVVGNGEEMPEEE